MLKGSNVNFLPVALATVLTLALTTACGEKGKSKTSMTEDGPLLEQISASDPNVEANYIDPSGNQNQLSSVSAPLDLNGSIRLERAASISSLSDSGSSQPTDSTICTFVLVDAHGNQLSPSLVKTLNGSTTEVVQITQLANLASNIPNASKTNNYFTLTCETNGTIGINVPEFRIR